MVWSLWKALLQDIASLGDRSKEQKWSERACILRGPALETVFSCLVQDSDSPPASLLPVAPEGSGHFGGKSSWSHARIPKDRDPQGPGQGQRRCARILAGVENTRGTGTRWPPGLFAPVSHPMGLQADCKNENPVKGRGTLVSQLPATAQWLTLLFREMHLNNEQVRTAGAILSIWCCNPVETGIAWCVWKKAEIRRNRKDFHRWNWLALRVSYLIRELLLISQGETASPCDPPRQFLFWK